MGWNHTKNKDIKFISKSDLIALYKKRNQFKSDFYDTKRLPRSERKAVHNIRQMIAADICEAYSSHLYTSANDGSHVMLNKRTLDRGSSGFPQQVSSGQDDQDRSEIAFSNGASFPAHVNEHVINFENQSVRNESLNALPDHESLLLNTYSEETTVSPILTQQPKHPQYVNYGERLRTFARWIRGNPGPYSLCDAGFFFTNQADLVRCFQCGIGLKDFSDGVDPLFEHVKHSGNCSFLLEHLGSARLASIRERCREQQRQRPQEHSTIQCRHPEYQTYESRLSTFTGWPRHLTQKPEDLAEAGLYFIGVDDLVRCFSCDGGLKRWDAEDVPWIEHCRWFPTCPFAREKKGDDFIALIQASAEYTLSEPHENEESFGGDDLSGAMDQMALRDPVLRAALEEHKKTCLEMGYNTADITEAVEDLQNMGTITPTIEELIDMVEVVKERKESRKLAQQMEQRHHETPLEENQRLKSFVTCMTCDKNNVNCLFIPCTHHRLCMECAKLFTQCPVCDRQIRQKIRTYLV